MAHQCSPHLKRSRGDERAISTPKRPRDIRYLPLMKAYAVLKTHSSLNSRFLEIVERGYVNPIETQHFIKYIKTKLSMRKEDQLTLLWMYFKPKNYYGENTGLVINDEHLYFWHYLKNFQDTPKAFSFKTIDFLLASKPTLLNQKDMNGIDRFLKTIRESTTQKAAMPATEAAAIPKSTSSSAREVPTPPKASNKPIKKPDRVAQKATLPIVHRHALYTDYRRISSQGQLLSLNGESDEKIRQKDKNYYTVYVEFDANSKVKSIQSFSIYTLFPGLSAVEPYKTLINKPITFARSASTHLPHTPSPHRLFVEKTFSEKYKDYPHPKRRVETEIENWDSKDSCQVYLVSRDQVPCISKYSVD